MNFPHTKNFLMEIFGIYKKGKGGLNHGGKPPYPLTGIIKIREHLLSDKPASSGACGDSKFRIFINRVSHSCRLDVFIPKVFEVLGGFFQKAPYSLDLQQPQILAGKADDYALLAGEQAGGDALGVALLELLGGVVGRHKCVQTGALASAK